MGKSYDEAEDGEWITPVQKGYRLQCCDCGLVHVLDFRLVEPNGDYPKGAIQFRARRDRRATAQAKRGKKGRR